METPPRSERTALNYGENPKAKGHPQILGSALNFGVSPGRVAELECGVWKGEHPKIVGIPLKSGGHP